MTLAPDLCDGFWITSVRCFLVLVALLDLVFGIEEVEDHGLDSLCLLGLSKKFKLGRHFLLLVVCLSLHFLDELLRSL